MKPSLYHLAIVLGNTVKAQRCVLYKNGTFAMIFENDKQSPDDLLDIFKKIDRPDKLTLQASNIFDNYHAYYCFYDEYSNVCLFYIEDENISDRPAHLIKRDILLCFEEDIKTKIIIFDTEKDRFKDYEPTMYLFVNNDLNMGKGKIGGQVGHAVGKLVEKLVKKPNQEYVDWSQTLCKKIVLKASTNQLIGLSKLDGSMVIHDAGRTQIPSGSLTVVGFPPKYLKNIPSEFTQYKLL